MSNYNIAVNWAGKDALSDSDPDKVISGDDFNTEFNAVKTAVNTKADLNGSASESFSATTATAGTNTTQVATTAFVTTAKADCLLAGDLLDEDDMVSNDPTAPASQQSIKAYIDAQTASLVTTNITSGTANHGDILPLPSGYTAAQCTYLASLKYIESDVPSGKSQDGIYITVDVDVDRVVTCQFANNQGSGPHYGTINWICIAQK